MGPTKPMASPPSDFTLTILDPITEIDKIDRRTAQADSTPFPSDPKRCNISPCVALLPAEHSGEIAIGEAGCSISELHRARANVPAVRSQCDRRPKVPSRPRLLSLSLFPTTS